MSSDSREGTSPQANIALTPSVNAVSTMSRFIPVTSRKDMSAQELSRFKYEWATFERVWMYNYTASTLNAQVQPLKYSPWQFINKNEQYGYSNGQLAHISYYSTAALTGVFNNVRVG